MADLTIPVCDHKGWSLWINWWEWWCGACGITFPEYDLLPFINEHKTGDVKYFPGEEESCGAEA